MVPLSGGETVYLKAAFGDFVSFVFSWLRAVVLGPTSCAFLAIVSGRYILLVHPEIQEALESSSLGVEWAEKILAVGLMSRYSLSALGRIPTTLSLSSFLCRQHGILERSSDGSGGENNLWNDPLDVFFCRMSSLCPS